jgi:hypothetical protein
VWRNVYARSRKMSERAPEADDRGPFFKAGEAESFGGGRRYIFHNTALQPSGAGGGISGNTNQPLTNTVTRNNIWHIWKRHWDVIREAGGSRNDFDYDLYNGKIGAYPGAEKNGIAFNGAPDGKDKGVRIANFNDGFVGAAPDIGAQENGAPPMRFGLDAAGSRDLATLRTARKQ